MAYSSKYWRLDLGMQAAQTDGDQLSELACFDGTGAAISLAAATVTASSTGTASNAVVNSIFSGAAVGTFPTGWTSQHGNGVAVAIVGVGVEDGINYVDIHFSGTPTSTGTLTRFVPSPGAELPVSGGSSVVGSAYIRMVAGSTTNISNILLEVDQSTSGGTYINGNTTSLLGALSASGIGSNRVSSVLAENVNAANYFGVNLDLAVVSGAAVDITLRYGGVQFEYGTAPSAYVPTPTSGASGAPSVLTDGSTSSWWYPGALAAGGTASLYLTFPSAVDVGSIQFTQGNNLFEGPANAAIYTSPDGSTWTKVASANFAAWSGTTPQTVILTAAEISQLGAQALTVNNPEAEIFQFGAQALTVNDPAAEISQLGAQALTVNNPAARIFQAGLLAFVQYYPPYQVFQLGAEALTINDPQAQIGQLGAQALTINEPDAQVFQLGLMAFVRYVPAATPAPLTVTRKAGTRIDVALTYDSSLRALDTVFDGKDFVLDETPVSVLLGSLLVDRRAHPDDTWPPAVPDWANPSSLSARKGWVGDALDQHGLLVGSRLWELDRRLAEEQTRSDCQDYLVEAVQPLESQRGYAIKIQVAWEMPQILGYSVTVGSTTIQLKKALS